MSDYSSFYLYRKYKITPHGAVDTGIVSLDGEGTMPPVMKEECDSACGCIEPQCRCADFTYSPTAFTVSSAATSVAFNYTGCTKPDLTSAATYNWITIGNHTYNTGTSVGNIIANVSANTSSSRTATLNLSLSGTACQNLVISQESGATPVVSPKYVLTLNDSSTVSAECDSTSAISRSEISAYSATVTSAVIGDCVTELSSTGYGNGVFQGCTGLTSVTIPDSVTTLGAFTFRDCTGITSINIPDSVTVISNNAFDTCTGLTGITIPSGVTVLNSSLFFGCTSLSDITIPSGVTSIGTWGTFYGCSGLTSITVEATTPPTLGISVFEYTNDCPIYVPCTSVDTYKAASGWSSYADRIQGIPPCGQPVFEGKYQLTLNDSSTVSAECDSTSSVTSGEVANQYSGTVVSAEIGQCVTSIGNAAFFTCTRLTSVTIPDSVTSIGYSAFANCSGLTSVSIPNSVTSIDNGVFWGCNSLTSIDIPDSVTSIGEWAFFECTGLTSCTIGTGVTSISGDAFGSCSSLTSVTVNATTPPTLGEYAFLNTNNCPIYVPSASVNTYKSASGWSSYSSRIQAIP